MRIDVKHAASRSALRLVADERTRNCSIVLRDACVRLLEPRAAAELVHALRPSAPPLRARAFTCSCDLVSPQLAPAQHASSAASARTPALHIAPLEEFCGAGISRADAQVPHLPEGGLLWLVGACPRGRATCCLWHPLCGVLP